MLIEETVKKGIEVFYMGFMEDEAVKLFINAYQLSKRMQILVTAE